jgi:hypothetical protein
MGWYADHFGLDNPIVHGVWEGNPALKTCGRWWVLIHGSWKRVKDYDTHLMPPDEFKRTYPSLPPLPSEAFEPQPDPDIQYAVWQGRPTIFCGDGVWDLVDGAWHRISRWDVYSAAEEIPPDEFHRRFPSLPPLPREALEDLERLQQGGRRSPL